MRRVTVMSQALVFLVGSMMCSVGGPPSLPSSPGLALAADALKIDELPKDSRQFRTQVEQILAKVDSLIGKLKGSPATEAVVLDLIQTRDNVAREVAKIESGPGDAKWASQEMRESVQAMLKLLQDQYEKAEAAAT